MSSYWQKMTAPARQRARLAAAWLRIAAACCLLLAAACGAEAPPTPRLFYKADEIAAGNGPVYLAAADLNGDRHADIVCVNASDHTATILHGLGNGSFQAPLTARVWPEPSVAAIGDLNNDHIPDLIFNSRGADVLTILMGNARGAFNSPFSHKTGHMPLAVLLDDFDNDGHLDAAVTLTFDKMEIHLGAGNGGFKKTEIYSTGARSFSGVTGDFNQDGHKDIALAASSANSSFIGIFTGDGRGHFMLAEKIAQGLAPLVLQKQDMNGDGLDDLVAASAKGDNLYLFLARAEGFFKAEPVKFAGGGGPVALAMANFDDSPPPDVAVANSRSSNFSIVTQGAGAQFHYPSQDYPVRGGSPLAIASADFNEDGRMDIAVAGNLANIIEIHLQRGAPILAG